ncbi:hypothetical protein HYW55_00955 [Candidatus Gottesmanbacteria bacterium]|nr:hypothetical protein [Candidatus Gottesmanbacteria bacterium]
MISFETGIVLVTVINTVQIFFLPLGKILGFYARIRPNVLGIEVMGISWIVRIPFILRTVLIVMSLGTQYIDPCITVFALALDIIGWILAAINWEIKISIFRDLKDFIPLVYMWILLIAIILSPR